jgi:hypothetical protein
MTETTKSKLDFTLKSLEDLLKKCEGVDYSDTAGSYDNPVYVIGWTIGVLRATIVDFKQTIKEL